MADNNYNNSAPPPPVPIPNPGYTAPPNPGSYFSQGWALVQQNLGMAIMLALIPGIAVAIIGGIWGAITIPAISGLTNPNDIVQALGSGITLIATIAAFILFVVIIPALQVGVLACFWQGLSSGQLSTDALTSRMHMYIQVIIAGFIIGFINMVISGIASAIPGIGSLLSIIISLPLMSWSWLTFYDLAVRDDGAIPALMRSFELLKSDFFNLTVIGLLAYLLSMVGVFLCLVGSLITTPVINAAYGYLYRDKNS